MPLFHRLIYEEAPNEVMRSLEGPHVTHELEEGDSIYFSSTVPHRLHNQSSRPCEFMLIVSPPRF